MNGLPDTGQDALILLNTLRCGGELPKAEMLRGFKDASLLSNIASTIDMDVLRVTA